MSVVDSDNDWHVNGERAYFRKVFADYHHVGSCKGALFAEGSTVPGRCVLRVGREHRDCRGGTFIRT